MRISRICGEMWIKTGLSTYPSREMWITQLFAKNTSCGKPDFFPYTPPKTPKNLWITSPHLIKWIKNSRGIFVDNKKDL